ncbi:tyrosine-type recombinase/integrase [Bowmanella pacifica]|uniref:Site-specific recombinase phage integrase family protein n=1 Tax=Bowmanella pacifica TaxID=502051 RepID=A0A917YS27_9ALTE|nr:tyrosine-type recombinase/integrase [Bowmanella pacifica]GGO65325.1 site-specific recombinase phage integrase family protein [Bowmanella pacifica]
MTTQTARHDIEDNLYIYTQDNSKYWYARFQLFGKWYCKSTKEKERDKAIAKAHYIILESRIKAEQGTLSKSRRFRDVAELAISKMENELEHGGGKVIYKDYINALNKYHVPFFDRTFITSIDQQKIREFDRWRTEKVGRSLAKSTILNHNAAMQMVFKEAIEQKWMIPVQVPVLSNTGASGERRASFTPDEYDRIYDTVVSMQKNSRKEKTNHIRESLLDYMEFVINTGMRPGSELDNLTWGDIRVEAHEHKIRFFVTVRKGKTTKHTGTREVVCKQNIFDTIRLMTMRFKDRKATDKLFRLRDGSTTKELGRTFDSALEEAGLKESAHGPRTLYSLRHSYITWELLSQNVTIDVIAKQCGTSIQMIEQHYNHVIPRMFSNQLSGVEFPEIKQIQDRFNVPEKTKTSFTNLAKEWEANFRRRGCI